MVTKPEQGTTIWITNVGSHMWGHERPDSDIDLYVAYRAPIRHILVGDTGGYNGGKHKSYENSDGIQVDEVSYEIGHIVKQVLSGNVNHLWGVLSPLMVHESRNFSRFQNLTVSNLAKNCYHSIKGLATKNFARWYRDGYEYSEKGLKKLNIIARTLQMGIKILDGQKRVQDFFTVDRVETPREIESLIGDLECSFSNSGLPEKPDPEPFKQFLYEIRLLEIL